MSDDDYTQTQLQTLDDGKPKFGAQMGALGREAAKDVNNTLHQVFFGQQAGGNEPGTPLSPTQQQVTEALEGKNVQGQGGPQETQQAEQAQQDKLIEQTAQKEKNVTTEKELKKDMAQTRGRRSRGR